MGPSIYLSPGSRHAFWCYGLDHDQHSRTESTFVDITFVAYHALTFPTMVTRYKREKTQADLSAIEQAATDLMVSGWEGVGEAWTPVAECIG